ncbi:unnamed protein product [Gongylonema pulchrum]|uniref:GH97_N domain-containing protein n=1 Tax=Gongylonema pulchrum TaxID=637853 RepID=A0A183EX07_9BILA|nr:unnamed protein product [Gongylonema pulchrum]
MEWEPLLALNRWYAIHVSHVDDSQISLTVDNQAPVNFKLLPQVKNRSFKLAAPVHLGYAPEKLLRFSLDNEIFAVEWEPLLALNRWYAIHVSHVDDSQISLTVDNQAPVNFKLLPQVKNRSFKLAAPVHLGYAPEKLLRYFIF